MTFTAPPAAHHHCFHRDNQLIEGAMREVLRCCHCNELRPAPPGMAGEKHGAHAPSKPLKLRQILTLDGWLFGLDEDGEVWTYSVSLQCWERHNMKPHPEERRPGARA